MAVVLPTLHAGRPEAELKMLDERFASKDKETGEQLVEYSTGGQIAVRDSLARFKIVFAGRRWGKSRYALAELLACALPGGRSWWVWPVRDQALEAWEELVEMAGHLDGVEIWETKKRMKFPGGGYIWIKSADNPATLRGGGLDLCVIDEFEYIRYGEKLFAEVIRPALADRQGDCIMMSSAAGFSYLYDMANKAEDMTHWEAWRFPTWSSPFVEPEEVALLKEEMDDDVFRREIACETISAEGSVFGNVYRFEKGTAIEVPELEVEYAAGLDLARLSDYTAVSISKWGYERREQASLTRWRMMHWDDICDDVVDLLVLFHVTYLVIDTTGIGDVLAEKVIDELEEKIDYDIEIVQYVFSGRSKTRLVRSLRWSLNKGKYIILDDKKLIGELQDFKGKKNAQTMHISYEAEHGNDDLVIATALDAWGIEVPEVALAYN